MLDRVVDGIDGLWAGWSHEGEAAELVRALKYGRVTAMVTPIADRMASAVPASVAADMVTWAPCSPQRRRSRGFDPAELLARALARRLGLAARRGLRRDDDQPQTSRDLAGRLDGPRLRAAGRRLEGRVLLVDDVCTTGSTLRAAAAALRAHGAAEVVAVVATATSADVARAAAAGRGTSTMAPGRG